MTRFLMTFIIFFLPAFLMSQVLEDAGEDTNERVMPEIYVLENDSENDEEIHIPDIINLGLNKINLNGDDWTDLCNAFANTIDLPLSIVHIGDSHIQADFATKIVRKELQLEYGSAGRGLIIPFKISGTNQPYDYTFSSSDRWTAQKLMKLNGGNYVGFTGAAISPTRTATSITLTTSTRDDDDYEPFSSIQLFHSGYLNITKVTNLHGEDIAFKQTNASGYTELVLDRPETEVEINFNSDNTLKLYGAVLSGDRPGVFYHTIGNNGATFDTYNNISDFSKGIKQLSPNLVILSLGTNEAFGNTDTQSFYNSIDRMVKSIKSENPHTHILLTTPMECNRSKYRNIKKRVRVRTKNGKRKYVTRNVRQRTGQLVVNDNVVSLRNTILKYASDNCIPVYDWYSVAGGDGAGAKWLESGLFVRDGIHHTASGYKLQGELLYQALKAQINN